MRMTAGAVVKEIPARLTLLFSHGAAPLELVRGDWKVPLSCRCNDFDGLSEIGSINFLPLQQTWEIHWPAA